MNLEQRVELLEKAVSEMQEAAQKLAAALNKASTEAAISLVENLKQTP